MKLSYFTTDESFPFFIQYGKHTEDLFLHTHRDFSELVIILNGSATHIVNNEKFLISKGDVFVINHNTSHGFQDTKDLRICNIMYRSSTLFSFDHDITKSAGFHALFVLEPYLSKMHKFESRLKLSPFEFDRVFSILEMMVTEYHNKYDGWKTLLKSSFLTLVVMLSRFYHFNECTDENNLVNIAKSVSYIENNYTDNFIIYKLAKLSNYSERQFIRIFKETYHTTPLDYIITLRIKHACALLRDSKIPVSAIAFQSGFCDSNYFSRIFKKRMGCTPTQFRNNI